MHYAAQNDNKAIVERLLVAKNSVAMEKLANSVEVKKMAKNSLIDVPDRFGRISLHWAVERGHIEVT